MLHVGCVENRMDPMKLGRCQVRIVGLHTEDKTILPTEDLPWAYPLGSITSASISGIGRSPTGVVQGSWVVVDFLDEDNQQPIMLGTIGGIPQTKTAALIGDNANSVVTTDESGSLVDSSGADVNTLMDQILTPQQSIPQTETTKYKIDAVLINGTPGFYVKSKGTNENIASAVFDAGLGVYTTTLLNPEKYTQNQYLPFTGNTPKTFTTLDEMSQYFDTNF